MIRDIEEYSRLDSTIVSKEQFKFDKQPRQKLHYEPLTKFSTSGFNAKVLSRLFWPELEDETFRVPKEITMIQRKYEEGFEKEQSNRKLTWLQSQGLVVVELELEDRLIREEGIYTWQATVIYAFQSEDGEPVERSIDDLVLELEMSEALVRSACRFWVEKLVLQEVAQDTYKVLEKLDTADRLRSQAARGGPAPRNGGEDKSSAAKGMEGPKAEMYWSFVLGMLKNGGKQMAVVQIAMMLKVLIAEGFPFSNEELKGFLDGKVGEGRLEVKGGKYKLKK